MATPPMRETQIMPETFNVFFVQIFLRLFLSVAIHASFVLVAEDGGVENSPRLRRLRVASRTSDLLLHVRRHPLLNYVLPSIMVVVICFFLTASPIFLKVTSSCHGGSSAPGELVKTDVRQVSHRPRRNRFSPRVSV